MVIIMRTYYIFNVNEYFSYMYKNKPFKMYKILEEIYRTKEYDIMLTYHVFEQVASPFNKVILNEFLYHNCKFKSGYTREGNMHIINNVRERSKLTINNSNIKIRVMNNYSDFFEVLSSYDDNLFVCDFNNKDYFWLSKLCGNSLQKDKMIVK